ncbi:Uncharacterized protein FWK35_00010288 [Aphis craccivora]|uniref:Uncharacterized protein n=1 Tax=Aphis craccivora TaxID=307492 RepID=A0A6G0YLU0_APHCR|nr:Uncharacterized protein FWK35_00010288 [Aphis craccivora]
MIIVCLFIVFYYVLTYFRLKCLLKFKRAYIGITVCNLRYSKALACRRMLGRHAYENITEIMDSVINEFNLQNKIRKKLRTNY